MQDPEHPAVLAQAQSRAQLAVRGTRPTQCERAVLIRAVRHGDEARLRRMFSRLSLETIYRRFQMPYHQVPEWALASFTKANPYHGGVVAIVGDEIVGHAMYVRSEDGREAEFAILVEDGWQSKGMGKLLLSELAEEAKCRGIESFTAIVLKKNRRVLGLIDSVFTGAKRRLRHGSYYICAPLRSLKPIIILEPAGSTLLSA